MSIFIPKSYWRFFVILFFSIVFCFIFYHALFLMSTPDAPDTWLVGDWLINYQGGFIRRGLIGEIFFFISKILGIKAVFLVVIFQILVYCVFILGVTRLSLGVPFSASSFLLIASPAFMLFPILDYQGAFRKEIMLLALLSMLCVYLKNPKSRISNTLMLSLGAASVFIILSHEMLVAYLPYVICAFILNANTLVYSLKKILIAFVPAVIVAVLLMIFFRGTSQNVEAICDSLKPSVPLDCVQTDVPGAVSLLGDGISSARDLVSKSGSNGIVLVYMAVALLSIIPLAAVWYSRRFVLLPMTNKKYLVVGLMILAIFASIPLLWVASDYGRIIYIHVSCLSILTLMVIQDVSDESLHLTFKQTAFWIASILFVMGWRLIHWGATVEKTFPFLKLY